MIGDRYLTSGEAARYLGYSVAALQLWRCQGGGPVYVKINRNSVRYRKSALDAWITSFGTRRNTSQAEADPVPERKPLPRLRLKETA